MSRRFPLWLLLVSAPAAASDAWPPKFELPNGDKLIPGLNLSWDTVHFSGTNAPEDVRGVRRSEVGLSWRSVSGWEASATYDFEGHAWADAYLRLSLKTEAGQDWGKLRLGHFRVPLGMEASASSRTLALLETALPSQALGMGRRVGLDWNLSRPAWQVSLAGFGDEDLRGRNPGTTVAGRALWTPRTAPGDVLHLGMSAALEHPRGTTSASGAALPARLRMRARPGTGIGSTRIIDSGNLGGVDSIRRLGVELAWIQGPFSVQAEALQLRAEREQAGVIEGEGHYAMAAWVLSGESRGWRSGHVGHFSPEARWGGLELLLRHDQLRLHGSASAQRARSWTWGVNWYLGPQFRLQLNHVRARNERAGQRSGPDVTELRAHVFF